MCSERGTLVYIKWVLDCILFFGDIQRQAGINCSIILGCIGDEQ